MSNWQGFERLAETIYRELHDVADVQWDDHIHGHDTEMLRQIDVSIRWSDGDRERLAIVQVKNWKTRANVNAVGEFASVVRDVRADKGVMVCNAGFSKKAHTYARNLGIELHNLHDAQSKDWRRNLTVPILWSEQLPELDMNAMARFEAGDKIHPDQVGFVDLGNVQRDFHSLFVERWNVGELDRTPGLHHPYDPLGPVSLKVTAADGTIQMRPTAGQEMTYKVNQRSWLGQFEPEVCRGYVDYLQDDAFVVTYLPVGEVPRRRDEAWVPVSDPGRVAVTVAGTLVTTQQFQVGLPDSMNQIAARLVGP